MGLAREKTMQLIVDSARITEVEAPRQETAEDSAEN